MSNFRRVEPSATLLINQQSQQLETNGQQVYKFGFGQSPFLPPGYLIEQLQVQAHRKEYTAVQGLPALRSAIANFHEQVNGLKVSPNQVLVAPGSKILLYTILAAFQEADVFIPSPAWVSYAPQARLVGHQVIAVETSFEQRWRVTPEALIRAQAKHKNKQGILIINYPANPDGLSYTSQELTAIAAVARQFNWLVISDEIYGLLSFRTHHSFAQYYPERTITTTGLSKWCGAGGWRLGAALLYEQIEAELENALIGIASETYSCASTPVQLAAIAAYENPTRSMAYVAKQIECLQTIGDYCYQELAKTKIRLHPPEGGFYLFPDFTSYVEALRIKGITTSEALCSEILTATGVALLPATAFGFEAGYLAARLAYVDFDDPLRKANFDMARDCPKIVEGIGRLVDWLKAVSNS